MPAMKENSDREYQVSSAVETLRKAEEIKQDKQLYAECLKQMESQMMAMHKAMGEHKGKAMMMALGKMK